MDLVFRSIHDQSDIIMISKTTTTKETHLAVCIETDTNAGICVQHITKFAKLTINYNRNERLIGMS